MDYMDAGIDHAHGKNTGFPPTTSRFHEQGVSAQRVTQQGIVGDLSSAHESVNYLCEMVNALCDDLCGANPAPERDAAKKPQRVGVLGAISDATEDMVDRCQIAQQQISAIRARVTG